MNKHVRFPVHCPSDSNFTVQKVANNIVVKGASYIRRKKEISFYIQVFFKNLSLVYYNI